MRTAIFENAELQKQFDLNGFVVVPFLSEEKVKELNDFYSSSNENSGNGFYSTSFNADEKNENSLAIPLQLFLRQRLNLFSIQ